MTGHDWRFAGTRMDGATVWECIGCRQIIVDDELPPPDAQTIIFTESGRGVLWSHEDFIVAEVMGG